MEHKPGRFVYFTEGSLHNHPKNQAIYFKIHGTADDKIGETLIYALRHERSMKPEKSSLLQEILHNNRLLVVGYSGRDFELCPEIYKSATKEIIWSTDNAKDASPNARFIVNEKEGYFVEGDMLELISRLFFPVGQLEKTESKFLYEEIRRFLTSERAERTNRTAVWRTKLLASMHCASMAIRSADELLSANKVAQYERVEVMVQKAWALMFSGKYKDSIHLLRRILREPVLGDPYARAMVLVLLSDVYRCRGLPWSAFRTLKKATELRTRVNDPDKSKELEFMALAKKGNISKDIFLLSMLLRIPVVPKMLQEKMMQFYRESGRMALELGNWPYVNEIRLRAEQVGLNLAELFQDFPFEPPPSFLAYEHIAILSGVSMSSRHEMGKKTGRLSNDEKVKLFRTLSFCEAYEIFPEIWTSYLLICQREGYRRTLLNGKHANKMVKAFLKCQYALWLRMFVPFLKGRL